MSGSNRAGDPAEVARLMMHRLLGQLDVDLVYFHLDPGVRLLVASGRVVDPAADERYWAGVTWKDIPAETAYLGKVAFTFSRTRTDPVSAKVLRDAPTQLEDVLSVPLVSPDGAVLGGLDVGVIDDRDWTVSDVNASRALAGCLLSWFEWELGVQQLGHVRRLADRRNEALKTSAALLLAGRGDGALAEALRALMDATDASLGFIERNATEGGELVTTNVCYAPDDGSIEAGRWTLRAWSEIPKARARLSAGEPHFFVIGGEDEEPPHAESWVASEVTVPVFVGGEWVGLVGFADRNPERSWTGDLALLQVAAAMIGAFWSNQSIDKDVGQRAARERALAECARILLSDDDTALEMALVSIVQATSATIGFVERNVWDPVSGLVSEVVALVPPGSDMWDIEHWDRRPWSTMPDTYRKLSRGEMFALSRDTLGPIELSTYAGSAIGGELNAPIMVNDQWRGLLGIAVTEERPWSPEEEDLLRAAAAIVGAYWDRLGSVEELREVVRSKDRFLASVSHEVRTPLTAVVGLSEILRSGFDEYSRAQQMELIELISEQGFEMTNIIEDLLVAGRMEIDAVSVLPERIVLSQQVAMAMRGVNGAEKVVVEHSDVEAMADPVRFRQILRNLVTNALRYGGETVVITISAGDNGFCKVSVGDNGVGVRSADTERIFNPYERAGDAPSSAGSVGIGLTVSRHLARKLGGDLVYARRPGWTWFHLTLPGAR